ncbi:MAG: hypothetical protein GY856_40070, partial [bacterium]|nr:hypothetical protein [bacterium]
MTDVSGLVYEKAFGYDTVGNRLTQTHADAGGTTTTSYTYDDRDRLLTSGDTSYSWDANGNLTEKAGEATYGWDF